MGDHLDTYLGDVLAFLGRIDDASVSGLLDREMMVEANKLRLQTQVVMGRTRIHGAGEIDAIIYPDLPEDRR